MSDIAEIVLPGFAAFAGVRGATKIAVTQIAKLKPTAGKHAGAAVSVGAFLAAWFLAHRVKFLAKYHTGVVVGSAIAAMQSLIQLYMPGMGWLVADATPAPQLPAPSQSPGGFASQAEVERAQALKPVHDDPNEFTYDESFDAGRYSGSKVAHVQADQHMGPDLSDIDTSDLGVLSN